MKLKKISLNKVENRDHGIGQSKGELKRAERGSIRDTSLYDPKTSRTILY